MSADAEVEQASSSETQQGQTLQVPRLAATDSLVELESSRGEHSEQSWWSSNWMTEAVAEEAETSAIEQSFLEMLEREHQWTVVQDRSLSTGQSAEHDPSASAQLCVSSTTNN